MRSPARGRSAFNPLACAAGIALSSVVPACDADVDSPLDVSELSSDSDTLGFLLFRGWVIGAVWNDSDGDGAVDFGDSGLGDVVVYLDADDDGTRDPGERFTRTGAAGVYLFTGLPSGDYVVRQEVPFGYRNNAGGDGPDPIAGVVVSGEVSLPQSIIGGAEAAANEYPFMVAVGAQFGEQFFQFCGGVLVTDRWVVTAAHCSDGADPAVSRVLAGTNNVDDDSGVVLEVERIYLHPDYVGAPDAPGEPFSVAAGYDIALWELSSPVALADSGLETLAMLSPDNADLAAVDALATTVGWGVSDLASTLLQDVHLPVFDDVVCADVYSTSINFDTQICGGVPEGGIDACQGDSGGPLMVRDPHADRWMLAGITSYGNGCALPGNPGVWARVSVLSEWATATAVEPSRTHRLEVRRGTIRFAVFGNRSTRREPAVEIPPRWQLVGLTVASEPDATTFQWRIFDEAGEAREVACELDPDGFGPAPSVSLACIAGSNEVDVADLEDGIYLPTLTASLADTMFEREQVVIIGTPPDVTVAGELTADDAVDPDFPGASYFIDYYDIGGLGGDRPIAIRVDATDFDAFVGLYDRELREAGDPGNVLEYFVGSSLGDTAELVFVPNSEVSYVVGVSTFAVEDTGAYTISIVNDGEPVATTLDIPASARTPLRKLPAQRLLIAAPIVVAPD